MSSRTSTGKTSAVKALLFLLLVLGAVITVRVFNLHHFLEKEWLRQYVAGYGVWGPIIYLIIWTVAPPLFLPGLPITLAGGVLFGPVWGVVYVAFGATAGATVAFLVARYLARDWVAGKLQGTRLATLDDKVAREGWEIVAFTRLVPIFPFFLINYAFGLTRISLTPYVLATFFGMLPLTVAYVYFSANVLDLFQGKFSKELFIGVLLLCLVSLIPFIYKKIKNRKGESIEL
ncbi:MAG: TVP38/TMEM64 family protein [Syntrophales bacterium]|nr:TVP38/TMEM64 family protein [Syntrophales bacterium]MDD5641543.1 TVP38/TMEM64 family protein [Syntrophales bacterium]